MKKTTLEELRTEVLEWLQKDIQNDLERVRQALVAHLYMTPDSEEVYVYDLDTCSNHFQELREAITQSFEGVEVKEFYVGNDSVTLLIKENQ